MSGFIAMHREAFDHPLLKDGERFRAWFWMVSKAAWRATNFDVRGKIVRLDRGQFCASRDQLAKELGWSPSAVERFLSRLETEQMIGRETGQGKSIITICNYAKYQDVDDEAGQESGQLSGQKSDRNRTAKEQGNKGTIEEEPNGSSPPIPPKSPKGAAVKPFCMTADWTPAALPPSVAELVARWPPGRFEREVEQFRDYWLDRTEKRPGWDRTFHNRIRDIHDRVIRDNRNGPNAIDRRDGVAKALDRRIEQGRPGESAREAGRYDPGEAGNVLPLALSGPRAVR